MHQLATTPEQQFAALLAADQSRPFVTYYDESSGERAELSVKSLTNWVVKTHHLLGTELGLGVGDTAFIALPAHWISVPVLLGCLTAGLAINDETPADVAFVAPDTLDTARDVTDVFVIAPELAAVGLRGEAPPPAQDYVAAVRPHEDKWPSVQLTGSPDDACLPGRSRGEVAELAAASGLPPGARILTTRSWADPQDWIDTVLAPIAVGGSVVIVANCPDEAVVARRMEQERATIRR
ncbi:MAG TPA: TIGR03089 family protein [Jatrophihabitantaceae bacterium]|nr:TIGR03089 family protein [Jatrophihabitantaceae bacterium]